jgi:hypothetical protein
LPQRAEDSSREIVSEALNAASIFDSSVAGSMTRAANCSSISRTSRA